MDEDTLRVVVRKAQAGETEAFAELYRHFFRRVLGLCRRLLGSREAAEDAANEVFLKAQRAMGSYNNTLSFSSWLLSIASHHCLDQLRRRRTEQRVFQQDPEEWDAPQTAAASPLAELLAAEQKAVVRAALDELPEQARVVLVLRYESGFSYDQIAAELGLSRNHVAILIFRAKKRLRSALEPVWKERRP
jgi:RNA polymerase sigma-70 factor (ECF subfamily)